MYKVKLFVLVLLFNHTISAQLIKGNIADEKGKALKSATIIDLKNQKYAVSDSLGNFIIKIPHAKKGIIQIDYLGYKTRKIPYDFSKNRTINLKKIKLDPIVFETDEVFITANPGAINRQIIMEIPGSVSLISSRQMQIIPSEKIDENLKYTSGIFVERPFGIFGKSVVGLRATVNSEPGRQLTLIDGIPINTSDSGITNWNRLIESDYQKIEVLKGPAATIYGNNAMGGVINLITKKPTYSRPQVIADLKYGTYQTKDGNISLMQKIGSKNRAFYYAFSLKGVQSDGYNTVPENMRQPTDTTFFIKEYGINTRLGYQFNPVSQIEIAHNYYNEYRGEGTKIRLKNGAVRTFKTNFFKVNYSTLLKKIKVNINTFYQKENYIRDIEKLKHQNYTYIKVNSDREDYGALTNLHYGILKHSFRFNASIRTGKVNGVDAYQTSTDQIINKGQLDILNFSLTDQWKLTPKLKSVWGINWVYGYFHDAAFLVEQSTSATQFMLSDSQELSSRNWNGISPHISLQYDFSKDFNIYMVISRGYRAASLDDLTRYGFINIGYKEANPNLKPETLNNLEIGTKYQEKKWALQTHLYYAKGEDFMNYIETGKTLFNGRKKIYRKENVTEVQMYGTEINADMLWTKKIRFNGNFTYNGSRIVKFIEHPDWEGKKLSHLPETLGNFTIYYNQKKMNILFNLHYQGKMFLDQANTFAVNDFMTMDAGCSYSVGHNLKIKLNVQNILDQQYMVSDDQISLGRFFTMGIQYKN